MNEQSLKAAACKAAETTPEHLGQPTSPPVSWWQKDELLYVHLADGRKMIYLLADYQPSAKQKPAPVIHPEPPPVKKQVEPQIKVTSLPIRSTKK